MMKNTKFNFNNITLPLFSAVAASVTFFLYAPFSLYLGNAEEFPFTLYDFFAVPLLSFLTAAAFLFAVGLILRKFHHPAALTVWCGFLFSIGLMTYLQGSFLFEDTGVFNGLLYDASEHTEHIVPNTAVWLLVPAVSVLLAVRFRKTMNEVIRLFSPIFSAFILVTLLVQLIGADPQYLSPRTSFVSEKGLFDVSSDRNVILIVPDMFDQTYMDTILEEAPELTNDLTGFVYYPETAGSFRSTRESLSYFLSQDALFDTLFEKGYSLGIYTDGRFMPDKLLNQTVNCVTGKAGISDFPAFTALLYRLVACSYAPDILRESVWLYGNEFEALYVSLESTESEYPVYHNSNADFYQALKENGLSLTADPCFRMIHLYGVHYPYVMDEYLHPITPSYSDENAIGAAKGTLRMITAYLNRLKDAGVYDRSLIILMADHGYTAPGQLNDPLLMIKLPEAHASFSISNETVPQEDFAEKIRALIP